MSTISKDKSIIIIGGGFAGLATGIYARLNGYNTNIFEMHTQPGGLCTSWNRKGYTFDGCIHWLVGSSPASGMHDMWEETGIAQNRKIIDHDEYMRLEGPDGRTLGGKYGDAVTREPYEKWPTFPSLIYISLGVNSSFDNVPHSVSGLTFHLKEPVKIGDLMRDKLSVHIFNHDPSLAPSGKCAVTLMFNSAYEYWKNIKEDGRRFKTG